MEFSVKTDFLGSNGKVIGSRPIPRGLEIEFLAESKKQEPLPLWFHLAVNVHGAECIRFVLMNAQLCLGNLHAWADNAPVYRSDQGPWKRCTGVNLEEREGHPPVAVFEVPVEGLLVELAFCYPYQQVNVEELIRECGVWKPFTIGYTTNGRPMTRYFTEVDSGKPGIFMVARQHSGETTGSWVLDGLMRRVASQEGAFLREQFQWWAVPFADLDGVEEGCYGKDHYPHDLNRAWSYPTPRTEVRSIQMDMDRFEVQPGSPLAVIDFHSPDHGMRGFYLYVPGEPESIRDRAVRFAELYYHTVPARLRGKQMSRVSGSSRTTSAQDGMKLTDFTLQKYRELPILMFTPEISYQGAADAYTIEDYRMLGSCMADALYRFYQDEYNL